ncbi:MAG: DNA repair protein RadC [Erysipelotrichaceae bacterium]|nr:DNA repair protein RadC [Erysipelotrichaceae bacterium]
MKIKDLPLDYRPREKALKYGFDALSDMELVAIILGSGTRSSNAVQLAEDVLSYVGGLNGLLSSSYQSLKKINGIKTAKALSLTSLVTIYQRAELNHFYKETTIESVLAKYEKRILVDKHELLVLVVLDRKQEIIKEIVIGRGTDSSVHFSHREIFKEIYQNNGYGFYLIHTHPNDISFPSNDDIRVTERLVRKSKNLGLHFLEHYVIGKDGYTGIFDFLKKKLN